ncbi:transposase [Streptomyces roseus]|uniref:transposase n=1 Tax=Streptomyces roseus TaxID=66430 RepID=UPI003F4CCB6A
MTRIAWRPRGVHVAQTIRNPGRKRHPNRLVFQRILVVLHNGIPWEPLPQELCLGSGMTCWRRPAAWTETGIWHRLKPVPERAVGRPWLRPRRVPPPRRGSRRETADCPARP